MYPHILRISQLVKALLVHFPLGTNPLERRMGPLLIEMDWAVYHTLNLLQSQNLNKVALKRYLSVLYRDDESVDPLMRAWIRASIWMKDTELSEIKRRGELYESIRSELKDLVPFLKAIYGQEESRYIVPPLFRS